MPEIREIIEVALIAAFIILFLGKTGLRTKLRDYFDTKGISLFADMLDCDFCLSFWLCFCIAFGFLILGYEIHFLITLLCAAPITRFIL